MMKFLNENDQFHLILTKMTKEKDEQDLMDSVNFAQPSIIRSGRELWKKKVTNREVTKAECLLENVMCFELNLTKGK